MNYPLGTVEVAKLDRTPVEGSTVPRVLADVCMVKQLAEEIRLAINRSEPSVEQIKAMKEACRALVGHWINEGSLQVVNVPLQGPAPRPAVPTSERIELHLYADPSFTRKYGKKVKDMGGRYTETRGYQTTRYVTLPNTEEGVALADKLLKECPNGKTTVILRGVKKEPVFSVNNVHVESVMADIFRTYDTVTNRRIDNGEEV